MSIDVLRRADTHGRTQFADGDYRGAALTFSDGAVYAVALAEAATDTTERTELVAIAEAHLCMAREAERLVQRTPPTDTRHRSRHAAEEADGEESARDWRTRYRPDLTLDDVIGMDEFKALVRDKVIGPLRDPLVYERFGIQGGGGLLLYGPPGTGKTYVARALAGELGCTFFEVNAAEIVSKWVGDTEKHIRQLMQQAKAAPRAVVFIDEIDALFPARGSRSTIANRAVSTFLTELDGFDPRRNLLLVVGATNFPDQLDEALVRSMRLDEHIRVGLPDEAARLGILSLEMGSIPQEADIDLAQVARQTAGYSAADVARVARVARQTAAVRERERREQLGLVGNPEVGGTVTELDFSVSLAKVHPLQISHKMLQSIEQFERRMRT